MLSEAKALLTDLGALGVGGITPHGRRLAARPLHPRLAHMLEIAGSGAALLAALMAERDPLRGAPPDLALRLAAVTDPRRFEAEHSFALSRPVVDRVRTEARRLKSGPDTGLSLPQMAALAYPDRIGLRRKGDAPRWLLSGGKGAGMAPGTPLAQARLIVATDLDGDPREAQVRQAVSISEADLRSVLSPRIAWHDVCEWSKREGRVVARRQERLGAIVLDDRPWPDAPPEALARAALDGLRLLGLPWPAAPRRLRARITLARSADWPEVTDAALLADDSLSPYLQTARNEADLRALDLTEALKVRIGYDRLAHLDRMVPAHFETPLGRRIPIDYDGDSPAIEVRLQEMFGVTQHPVIGAARLPLKITLLSPGQKPVQVTSDLPGFWANTYADVRRDMRGLYPRHPWPEDPTQAEPTLRAKPRGT